MLEMDIASRGVVVSCSGVVIGNGNVRGGGSRSDSFFRVRSDDGPVTVGVTGGMQEGG